jgi:hypothetical protein
MDLCCIVTVVQIEEPDLTVNSIEPCTSTRERAKSRKYQMYCLSAYFQYVFGY